MLVFVFEPPPEPDVTSSKDWTLPTSATFPARCRETDSKVQYVQQCSVLSSVTWTLVFVLVRRTVAKFLHGMNSTTRVHSLMFVSFMTWIKNLFSHALSEN